MKGFKHIFIRECYAVDPFLHIQVGDRWQCDFVYKKLIVPLQMVKKTEVWHLFVGFHELAHYALHKNETRDYDDLKQRIEIEIEADKWAENMMRKHGYEPPLNNATLGLIALYLYQGGKMDTYSFECEDDRFIILYRHGFEIFSHFVSQLPMHPCIY